MNEKKTPDWIAFTQSLAALAAACITGQGCSILSWPGWVGGGLATIAAMLAMLLMTGTKKA